VALRAGVAAYASEQVEAEQVEDVVLVVYELATNAVRHGGGRGRLHIWPDRGRIVCRVSDTGPGLTDAETRGIEPPPLGAAGGRGLWIARRLSALHIDTDPRGTTVTATMPA
jgi:anti-sigma regulatory factor (Ser/Thr protein kinase)